ncbi:MAG: FAD-dependent monooxygenase [Deltaproteobacteria bacterium]|nr:FAD-dependent monooxygenase [Deltaproteobacteria bacterium]
MPMQTVLVVGAGPTGLMLGCELLRHGLRARLIDKASAPSPLSKAIVVHARSLEALEPLGVADQLCARGLQVSRVKLYGDGRLVTTASFDELDTRYPFLLSIPQCDTEAVLAARFEALGGRIERGVEVTALRQGDDDDGVNVTLSSAGGEEAVRAAWVVGCDGAHSKVRKEIGLDFPGDAFDEPFMLADVRVAWDVGHDAVTTFFSASGLAACFPMPDDRWRIIMTAPPGDEPPTREDIEVALRERSGRACTVSDPRWLARFRVHARQVERYRVGRVLLAGDAAHIHSPVGGQGMNTGLQDAHNLAWKLALVATGKADDRLLDSYHSERHGIGEGLLRATDYATRVATLKSPVARVLRNAVAGFLTSLEVVQARLVRTTAELTLNYKHSPIVGEHTRSVLGARVGRDAAEETPTVRAWRHFALAPGPGERAPDAHVVSAHGRSGASRLLELMDHRHLLLLFDGRAATLEGYQRLATIAQAVQRRFADVIAVHVVVPGAERPAALDWSGSVLHDVDGDLEERYGAQAECLYLLRPDLYVGFRSQPADEEALLGHLNRIFKLRPAALG